MGSNDLAEVPASDFVPGQNLELVHCVWGQVVQGKDGGRLGEYLQGGPLGYLSVRSAVPTIITTTHDSHAVYVSFISLINPYELYLPCISTTLLHFPVVLFYGKDLIIVRSSCLV